MIALKTLFDLPVAIFVFSLILLHVFVMGFWAIRGVGIRAINVWSRIALHGAAGLALLGLEMFALGYVQGWNRPVLCVSGLIMLVGLRATRHSLPDSFSTFRAELRSLFLSNRILFVFCVLMLLILLIGSLIPPVSADEVQYHWAAPLYWARAGGWVASPYRLMNGPALMHLLYSVAAIFSSSTAAHWTHALCLLLLACGCAGLAEACFGRPIAAFAGILSCPVLVVQSSVAYTDTGGAMFCVAAYVALLCGGENLEEISSRSALFCGLLVAATFSVKSFLLAALPAALVLLLLQVWRSAPKAERLQLAIKQASLILLPALAAAALWMAHTYALSGKLTDSRNVYFLHHRVYDSSHPPGGEVGRIPDLRDLATLPFVPIFTSVLGQKEPWGGRTGLLIVPFAPVGIFALRRLSRQPRIRAAWILAGAISSFFLLGLITEKTRYHAFVWSMLLAIAAVGYGYLQDYASPKVARLSASAFVLLSGLGMADAAHVVLRGIRALP